MRDIFLLLLLCFPLSARAEGKRVVSLMPSYTEIIFALGAGKDLVGVSNFCNYPPETAKIEKAGDYLRPNLEKVYSLKPDVVFTGAWASASTARQLSSLGIKVVTLPEEKKVDDILTTVRLIAAELGLKKEGEKLEKRLSASLPRKPAGKPVKVYIEADSGGWTTGGDSFLSDAVSKAGGVNVFGREKRGYFQATWEEVLLMDPEAVILLNGGGDEFVSRPMAKDMAAVKGGRVITGLDRDAFSRPGPRLFGEIGKLAALLAPAAHGDDEK
ncbi:MAG: ABC transporter substrate-binding protein [Elusimicrobia bacterium]|nr:ABC transporter substrate-binding protein [Elusimicrobiota bacterium]